MTQPGAQDGRFVIETVEEPARYVSGIDVVNGASAFTLVLPVGTALRFPTWEAAEERRANDDRFRVVQLPHQPTLSVDGDPAEGCPVCDLVWGMARGGDGMWRFNEHFRDFEHSKTKKMYQGPCEGAHLTYDQAWSEARKLGIH